jgi:hypothetical protein
MHCYETENRFKAIKAKNLWESHFDKGFNILVNPGSTLIMVKSHRSWRVIDLNAPNFQEQLDFWVDEIKKELQHA